MLKSPLTLLGASTTRPLDKVTATVCLASFTIPFSIGRISSLENSTAPERRNSLKPSQSITA